MNRPIFKSIPAQVTPGARSALIIGVLLPLTILLHHTAAASTTSLSTPDQQVDVTKLGFRPAHFESNRNFFRNYSAEKLNAADPGSKVIMPSEGLGVLYTSRRDEGSEAAPNRLKAYFVDISTGKLVRTQTWEVMKRRSFSDSLDSEARMFPLSGGRYAVMASHALSIYSPVGELSGERPLSEGMWAAESVADGDVIFLRHQSLRTLAVEYLWLDSRGLGVQHRMDEMDSERAELRYSATSDSIIYLQTDGLHKLNWEGRDSVICGDAICRREGPMKWKEVNCSGSTQIITVGDEGLTVFAVGNGPLWSRPTSNTIAANLMLAAISEAGNRLALLVARERSFRAFDSVQLVEPVELFVYDLASRTRVLVTPFASRNGDSAVALSPQGKRLMTFDGSVLRAYHAP